MALDVDLIYCAGGNRQFAQIAIDSGFLYGAQLPDTVYFSPYFVDQNWKDPNLDKYLKAVKQHSPQIASVLDWEWGHQLSEVLKWAESIAPFVDTIMIIPKVLGGIIKLPRMIGNKPVRLGYSIPTKHGGTTVPYQDFSGWPVHLLGGSPHKQRQLTKYMNVVSADGNYHQKLAVERNQFFVPDGSARYAMNRFWPTLKESNDGQPWGDGSSTAGAPYEAFKRSCENIMAMWQNNFQPDKHQLTFI